MRGNAGIFIIIAILMTAFLGFAFYMGFFNLQKVPESKSPQPTPYSISADPKYAPVKEKYNLDEEQLQILSTVDPNDND